MKDKIVFSLLVAVLLLGCGDSQNETFKKGAVVLDRDDLARINLAVRTPSFVITVPFDTKNAPTDCPAPTQPSCIWACNDGDPLGGVDDDTCSKWICNGCGASGSDVCEDNSGNTIPC